MIKQFLSPFSFIFSYFIKHCVNKFIGIISVKVLGNIYSLVNDNLVICPILEQKLINTRTQNCQSDTAYT